MPDNEKWVYNPIPGYQFIVQVEDSIGGMILVASHIKIGQESEARRVLALAAAAPELYAALEELASTPLHLEPALIRAHAALAKARGEQTDAK